MIIQLLGILDFICVCVLFIPLNIIAKYVALYLIIKGLFFIIMDCLNFTNYIDITIGVYIFLMYYLGISVGIITLLFIIYLLQKIFFCFVGGTK